MILSHACSYDEKVDIFALALVLYELLHPFRTNMERVRTLQNLRKNVIPQEAREAWPEASELITQMMSRNPKVRPLQNVSARVSVAREVAARCRFLVSRCPLQKAWMQERPSAEAVLQHPMFAEKKDVESMATELEQKSQLIQQLQGQIRSLQSVDAKRAISAP